MPEARDKAICATPLPPRSPKLNGAVERAHRTHTEEFYKITDSTFEIAELASELLEWERIYNTVRPHQALGYLTPLKFWKSKNITRERRSGVTNHMDEHKWLLF